MTNVSGGNSPKTRSEARAQRLMRCVSRLGPFGALIDIDSSLGSKRYINILYRVYNLQQKQSRRGKKKKKLSLFFFFLFFCAVKTKLHSRNNYSLWRRTIFLWNKGGKQCAFVLLLEIVRREASSPICATCPRSSSSNVFCFSPFRCHFFQTFSFSSSSSFFLRGIYKFINVSFLSSSAAEVVNVLMV